MVNAYITWILHDHYILPFPIACPLPASLYAVLNVLTSCRNSLHDGAMTHYMLISVLHEYLHYSLIHYILQNPMQFNPLHSLHAPESSLVAAATAMIAVSGAISARAVSSPFSVGFILPVHSDLCEVLMAYR